MAPSNEFYQVTVMDIKQALGLKREKPNLQAVMNRKAAQGYLAVHFVTHDGAVMVIWEKHMKVPTEEIPATTSDGVEADEPNNVSTLPTPEIVSAG